MIRTGAEERAELVVAEFEQRDREGYDVAHLRGACEQAAGLDEKGIDELWGALVRAEMRADFPYEEPSDWESVRAAMPRNWPKLDTDLVDGDLYDRLHGAWLGRCIACMLGKPCESLGKAQIEEWLRRADAYPLDDYFPRVTVGDGDPEWLVERFGLIDGWSRGRRHHEDWRPDTLRGAITKMVRDDDIDYPIMRLDALEDFGLAVTADDLAESFLYQVPYRRVWSAERIVYRNLVNGIAPPECATVRNPCREEVGATTRADVFGYVRPGQPERAVEMAFRDASWTHTKNGIYGELFAAAMVSAAFAREITPREIVAIGLAAVPAGSRLAEAIGVVLSAYDEGLDWEAAWSRANDPYSGYPWAHTIPNACWIAIGLLYGEGDFAKSIAVTVMCGMDTDSTAATVGSIMGAIHEAGELPARYVDPLNDTVESFVVRNGEGRISELARRTLDVVRAEGTNP